METRSNIILNIWNKPFEPLALALDQLEGLAITEDAAKIEAIKATLKDILPGANDLLIEDLFKALYVFKEGRFSRIPRVDTLSAVLNEDFYNSEACCPTLNLNLDTVTSSNKGFVVYLHQDEKSLKEGFATTEILIYPPARTCILRNYGIYSQEAIETIVRAGKFIYNHRLKFFKP